MHYVYVLRNEKNAYYIGYTNNIERRITEHKKHRPGFVLVYYEAYEYDLPARHREQKLKQYGSAWRGVKQRLGSA